jgi:hypothetical protein
MRFGAHVRACVHANLCLFLCVSISMSISIFIQVYINIYGQLFVSISKSNQFTDTSCHHLLLLRDLLKVGGEKKVDFTKVTGVQDKRDLLTIGLVYMCAAPCDAGRAWLSNVQVNVVSVLFTTVISAAAGPSLMC